MTRREEVGMESGSSASGLLGAVCGILLALFAIFVGNTLERTLGGGGHEHAAANESH